MLDHGFGWKRRGYRTCRSRDHNITLFYTGLHELFEQFFMEGGAGAGVGAQEAAGVPMICGAMIEKIDGLHSTV